MRHIIKQILLHVISSVSCDDCAKVIYYHDVGTVYTKMGTNLELLRAHIEVADSNGYRFVSPFHMFNDEVARKKELLLCFDDGFRGIYEERVFFVQNGITPLIFIAIDLIGRPGYLSWNEIRELQNLGFVFASHTWSHRSLTEVSSVELKHELSDSREELEQRLGYRVDQLCFPRGLFSLRVLDACAEAGYSTLFTSVPGDANRPIVIPGYGGAARLVPRILVQSTTTGEFKDILLGGMGPFQNMYLRKHFLRMDC